MTDSASVIDLTRGLHRRLYAGFVEGRRINAVSIEAEAWFWRLHAVADDFGNLPTDPLLLRSKAAPRRDVTVEQIEGWMRELAEIGLIAPYEDKGDRYAHIIGWGDLQPKGRNGKRVKRYPHSPLDASEGLDVIPDRSKGKRGKAGDSGGIQVDAGESSSNAAPSIPTATATATADPTPSSDGGGDAEPQGAGARHPGDPPARLGPAGWAPVIKSAYPTDQYGTGVNRQVATVISTLTSQRFDSDTAAAGRWLLERVMAFAASKKAKTTPPKFLPALTTWLRDGGYDDDDADWAVEYDSAASDAPPRKKTVFGAQ